MTAPRILVVADDRSIPQAVEQALGLTRAFVRAAAKSAALRLLAHHPIDIMFVDIDRQDDGGLDPMEFTRLVRERKPDVDIVAIAKAPSATMAMRVIATGAADCLCKAALAEEIGGVVNDIIERRRYRRERVPWPDGDLEGSAIIGHDPKFIECFKQVVRLAKSDDPVLIVGERGTGKTGVARAIHRLSRAGEPFKVLESTSITEGLAESKLFGHVKGAFTDAKSDHKGYFERAGRGTLVIDEVADLTHGTQGKLLRVLQDREFVPLGGTTATNVHARVIAITNRPLEDEMDTGAFRPDLYDRLLVGRIELPPLRERRGDIPELARYFIAKAAKNLKLPAPPFIVPKAVSALVEHDWPGNVRELENVIKPAVLSAAQHAARVILGRDLEFNYYRKHAKGEPVRTSGSAGSAAMSAPRSASSGRVHTEALHGPAVRDTFLYEGSLSDKGRASGNRRYYRRPADPKVERAIIQRALERAGGNRRQAAQLLGIARSYLYEKINVYGLHDVGRK